MAKARKLKVFQAQLGFYDTLVAAPSRPAALKAWGVHQDLFKSGDAREVKDAKLVDAATAHPETPLRRAIGSNDPFELEPQGLPKAPDGPRRVTGPKRKPAKAKAEKPPPDRSDLDAAEADLRELETQRLDEEGELNRRREALDAEIADSQATYVKRHKVARAKVDGARKAYRKAGGED